MAEFPDLDWCQQRLDALRDNIHVLLKGQDEPVELAILCVMAAGHLLIEDVPGVGKTTLATALAQSSGLTCRRVQFTSDILPSDILGVSIYDPQKANFVFHEGPIFTHIMLADEINRAEPRAQSALLEAMLERQVSVDGETRPLPSPFIVIATQNPLDFSGTFPLPDSQLDRFLFRISMGYPDAQAEFAILKSPTAKPTLEPVLRPGDVKRLQDATARVYASDEIIEEIQAIAHATRAHASIAQGISTRAMIDHLNAARARALFHHRSMVLPDDVRALTVHVHAHRIKLTAQAHGNAQDVLTEISQRIAQTMG